MKFLMNLLCLAILAGAAYCLYQQKMMQKDAIAIENSLEAVCSQAEENFEINKGGTAALSIEN